MSKIGELSDAPQVVGASGTRTPSPLRLLSLNEDVLSHIASFLSYSDALSLSSTCRAAQLISIDTALHTVVLGRSSAQLPQFRDFILAKTSRAFFVRSLTITKTVTWDIDGNEAAQALADILEKTTRLEVFSCGAMRELVVGDGRIKEHLIALTTLKELTLVDGGTEATSIATTTQSLGIERLALNLIFHDSHITFEEFFGSFVRFKHLTHLSITRMYARILFPHAAQYQSTRVCLPSVRHLTLTCTYVPLALASIIFPNVSHLHFSNARHYPHFVAPPSQPADHASSWPALAEAHIDARDLAVWPLASTVRLLDLDVLRGGYSVEALAAVSRMSPRVLACAYTIDADNRFWTHLPVIATELRFLDVRLLELSGNPRKYMLMHLARFPALTALFICIRAYNYPANPDAEIATLARSLAARNAKLRFVGLSFADGRSMREDDPMFEEERLGSTWFEIRRGETHGGLVEEDEIDVQEIPTAVGLEVRDYMFQADYSTSGWEERLATLA